jgi:Flp pilus assembly pilin Flp
MLRLLGRLLEPNKERGQDLVEYALLGGVIAAACVASMSNIATEIKNIFSTLSGNI